jgi:homeobox protein cut-like
MVPDIDLTSSISRLDATASQLVEQQKEALVERKDLAQKTKDFRKLEDSAKLTEYKALLKCTHAV